MTTFSTPQSRQTRYDAVAMLLHWLIAALMIYMLFFGEDLIRHQPDATLPSLHASLGISILLLSVLRLAWRIMNPPPPLPAGMAPLETKLAMALHYGFYALLIIMPLTGWLAIPGGVARHDYLAHLTFFGGPPIPLAPLLGLPMGAVHSLLGNLGIAMLGLHVLAALKHQFWNRDGLLSRMLPI